MKNRNERGNFEHVKMMCTSKMVCPVNLAKKQSQAERKSTQIPRPAVFPEYNRYMGGTNRMDDNVDSIRLRIKEQNKAYKYNSGY